PCAARLAGAAAALAGAAADRAAEAGADTGVAVVIAAQRRRSGAALAGAEIDEAGRRGRKGAPSRRRAVGPRRLVLVWLGASAPLEIRVPHASHMVPRRAPAPFLRRARARISAGSARLGPAARRRSPAPGHVHPHRADEA